MRHLKKVFVAQWIDALIYQFTYCCEFKPHPGMWGRKLKSAGDRVIGFLSVHEFPVTNVGRFDTSRVGK